jgi:hypothetical protein
LFIGGNNLFVLQEKLLVDISATIFWHYYCYFVYWWIFPPPSSDRCMFPLITVGNFRGKFFWWINPPLTVSIFFIYTFWQKILPISARYFF